jgi:hypothetical protein
VERTGTKMARTLAALALTAILGWSGLAGGAPHAAQAATPLTSGCNQVTETSLPSGSPVSTWVSGQVQPSSAVVSVWHYDNASQSYKAAYFQMQGVPVDQPNFTAAVDAFFICVNASATAP